MSDQDPERYPTNRFAGTTAGDDGEPGDVRAQMLAVLGDPVRATGARRFLDVGCGIGLLTEVLKELLPQAEGVGIDIAEETLALARAHSTSGVTYRHGDAYRIPAPDGAFDLTCCQTLLFNLKDPAAAIGEMLRVTRPGGTVLIIELLLHTDGRDSFVPGPGAIKKHLHDDLRRFLVAQREAAGIDVQVTPRIPHLLLQAGAERIRVRTHGVVQLVTEDRIDETPAQITFDAADEDTLALGYDRDRLADMKRAEHRFQAVAGEFGLQLYLIVTATRPKVSQEVI